MRCIDALLKSGFEVDVFVDGDQQHSTKRSSYTQAFEREKQRLESISLQRKLAISLQDNSPKDVCDTIAKNLDKANQQSCNTLPSSFSVDLSDAIEYHNHPNLNFFKSEEFQADPMIVKRSIDGLSDIIWSNDTDFLVHNSEAVLLKDF